MNPANQYIRCRTCGKYLVIRSAVNGGYCSDECTVHFTACLNCGRYFQLGAGYNKQYCTQVCAARYKMNRIFGPEPVTVLTEEIA